jgi:hypothetical protein
MSRSSDSRARSGLLKIFWFFFGLFLVAIGVVDINRGEVSFTVGTWYVEENPIRFWLYIAMFFIFGFWLMYKALTSRE